MRARQVQIGLRRLGLALAVAAAIPTAFLLGLALTRGSVSQEAINLMWLTGIVAVLSYPIARTLAWIISKFLNDA